MTLDEGKAYIVRHYMVQTGQRSRVRLVSLAVAAVVAVSVLFVLA